MRGKKELSVSDRIVVSQRVKKAKKALQKNLTNLRRKETAIFKGPSGATYRARFSYGEFLLMRNGVTLSVNEDRMTAAFRTRRQLTEQAGFLRDVESLSWNEIVGAANTSLVTARVDAETKRNERIRSFGE